MVLAKDASDGILQKKTKEFAEHLDDFLTELSESLRSGTYEPDPLLSFGIPKGTSGEVRTLHIPSIRDRVVERAVVNTITHKADLAMSPCSFAYRTGIGTDDAVDHLARLRDAGYCYVLRTDIEDYFPNLNIEDALAALSPIAGCPRTIDLIRLIARPRRARGERRTRNRGIAQGSCLSPLLANLALTDVDRAMGDAGYGYARFADDIVICSPHEPDLLEALELLDSLLTPRGLRLNQEKTAMTSFDEGFCYLGTDFSRSFPPVDPHHDIKGRPDPDQVVYVGHDGARVHISQNRLIVDGADGLLQTSMSSWGWRAPPQRPTSAACPGWSHRRSPSTGAAAAQGPGQRRPLLCLRDPAGRVHGSPARRRARALARGAARLHRQAPQPLPGPQRGRPAWPPRWRGGATGSRSPLSSCGWSPPSSTRCAGRSPRSSTRPTTSSTSTRYATPAWRAARSTGPRPRSTTPGCTEGCGEPAVRRERAAHERTPPRPTTTVSCATISAAGRGDECCRDGRLDISHNDANRCYNA